MSRSSVADFSIANTTRILNGVFEYDSKRPNSHSNNSGSGLMYRFVDNVQPEVKERLTDVLMQRALHQAHHIELARDISENLEGRIFRQLDTANLFFQDKLANAIILAYDKKKVGLFHRLLRYASLTNTEIPKANLDTLFDRTLKQDDVATYKRILQFKMGMNKRIYEQKATDPDTYEATVRESTQRLNQDLVELIKTQRNDAFLELVNVINEAGDDIYNNNADKLGFQQVKNYFFTKYTKINKDVADKIFEALGDDPDEEEKTTLENTRLMNNSFIELFEADPLTAILSFGRTVNLETDEYNPNLDPHGIPMMGIKVDALEDNKLGLDKNLLIGIKDRFDQIAKYHLGKNPETQSFTQHRIIFKKPDN